MADDIPTEAVRNGLSGHVPVKVGSSMSNIPGRYTGDWLICSCDPKDEWIDGEWHEARRIPIAEYPAHLFDALWARVEKGGLR